MSLNLRWKTALAFSLLSAVVLAALGLYLDSLVRRSTTDTLRDRLFVEARLIVPEFSAAHRLPPEQLGAELLRLDELCQARLTYIDPTGRVLAESRASASAMENHANRPERLEAVATGGGWAQRYSATLHLDMLYVAVALPATGGAAPPVLRLALPLTQVEAASDTLRGAFTLALLLALAVVFVVSLRLTDSLTRPWEELVQAARRVARGDLAARVAEPSGSAELRELALVFNSAVDQLAHLLATSQQETQRYVALLEQMTDGVVVIDRQGRVELINRMFAEMFGLDPTWGPEHRLEEVGLSYELNLLLTRALEQGVAQQGAVGLVRPQPRTLYGVATPLANAEGQIIGAIGLLRDMTELQRLDQVRRDFVANASHELRTPAAGIRALAEVLESGALHDPEKGPRFLAQIVLESDRLTAILDDMLTLTRVERGAELVHPRWIPSDEAFAEVVAHLQPLAMQQEVSLRTEAGAEDQVFADAAGLQTILTNLVDNAIKYTPGGGEIVLRGRPAPGGYEIAVSDTGAGIATEHLPRLFERFYRVDKARDRATGGTGLGLAIVKHLAEAHRGRVSVQSEIGHGSTFTVFLPAPLLESAAPPPAEP
ncbi:MAG TPA: ATP-binding protein [Armatimonadota bacterium]|jgi:two-component system phosphate regulon sensor histidine kinase PhoR